MYDLGYLGVEKDYSEQLSALPYRKKSNLDRSQEEIEYNKNHSKKRIVIEYTICRLKKYRILADVFRNKLKKYRILADVFRNKLKKYNHASDIVSGLVNYRIMNRYH